MLMPLLAEAQITENNRVIIYVWKSGLNGGENVGHVAIKTPNRYISLWPGGEASGPIRQFFERRETHFMRAYTDDKSAEERDAEVTICLYSLNTEMIEGRFDKIKDNLEGWTLLCGTVLKNSGAQESCASLALRMLKVGGIDDLVKNDVHLGSSVTPSIITPDELAHVSVEAKKGELKQFPVTQQYQFIGETQVMEQNLNKINTCVLV